MINATNAQNDVPRVSVGQFAQFEQTDQHTQQVHVEHLPAPGGGHQAAQRNRTGQPALSQQRQQEIEQAQDQQGPAQPG